MVKICPKCKIEKCLSLFGKHSKTHDGLQVWCKECRALYQKEHKENIIWLKELRLTMEHKFKIENKTIKKAIIASIVIILIFFFDHSKMIRVNCSFPVPIETSNGLSTIK